MKRFLITLAITTCFVCGVYTKYNERMGELTYRLDHIGDFKTDEISDSVPSPKSMLSHLT